MYFTSPLLWVIISLSICTWSSPPSSLTTHSELLAEGGHAKAPDEVLIRLPVSTRSASFVSSSTALFRISMR